MRVGSSEGRGEAGVDGRGEAEGSLWAGAPVRSSRRLSSTRRAIYRLAAPLFAGLARLLWASCRTTVVAGDSEVAGLISRGRPAIPCFWHRDLVPALDFLCGLRAGGLEPCLLISPSVDGELAAQVAEIWGARVVRGSSTRTGVRAMRGLYRALSRDGASPVLPADGPTGPECVFKPGAIVLSQLSGAPILPLGFAARWCLRLPTWDRLVVPMPFARVAVAVGSPYTVGPDLPGGAIEEESRAMGETLDRLGRLARAAL